MSEGGFDLGGLLKQAQDLQQQMQDAQAEAASKTVEGQAGGGVVKVVMGGDGEVQSVTIDPSVVDPDDVEMLQDLIVAAARDAAASVAALQAEAIGPMADLGDLDLGGLLGGNPGDDG